MPKKKKPEVLLISGFRVCVCPELSVCLASYFGYVFVSVWEVWEKRLKLQIEAQSPLKYRFKYF